jgi:hypothetical protein
VGWEEGKVQNHLGFFSCHDYSGSRMITEAEGKGWGKEMQLFSFKLSYQGCYY